MNNRKVHIFLFSVSIGVISKFLMPIEYYIRFLDFLLWLAIGFFSANGVEHLARKFKKDIPGTEPDQIGGKNGL